MYTINLLISLQGGKLTKFLNAGGGGLITQGGGLNDSVIIFKKQA